jgi:hypothetical protein
LRGGFPGLISGPLRGFISRLLAPLVSQHGLICGSKSVVAALRALKQAVGDHLPHGHAERVGVTFIISKLSASNQLISNLPERPAVSRLFPHELENAGTARLRPTRWVGTWRLARLVTLGLSPTEGVRYGEFRSAPLPVVQCRPNQLRTALKLGKLAGKVGGGHVADHLEQVAYVAHLSLLRFEMTELYPLHSANGYVEVERAGILRGEGDESCRVVGKLRVGRERAGSRYRANSGTRGAAI